MERMEGVDAGYLYMETPTMHMHTLKIALVQPSEAFDFDRLTRELLGRLHRLPPFTRRVLPVPFALNHPLWITDHEIDPTQHIFRHQVAAPGDMASLERLIGRIAGAPARPHRPAVGDPRLRGPGRRPDRDGREDAPRACRRRRGERVAGERHGRRVRRRRRRQ